MFLNKEYLAAKLIIEFSGSNNSYYTWEDMRLHVWLNQNVGKFQVEVTDLHTHEAFSDRYPHEDAVAACDSAAMIAISRFYAKVASETERLRGARS